MSRKVRRVRKATLDRSDRSDLLVLPERQVNVVRKASQELMENVVSRVRRALRVLVEIKAIGVNVENAAIREIKVMLLRRSRTC
jgi:hypothetical protein